MLTKRLLSVILALLMLLPLQLIAEEIPMYRSVTTPVSAIGIGIQTGYHSLNNSYFLQDKLRHITNSSYLKGDLGESIMHSIFTSHSGGSYNQLNPNIGGWHKQGIDGLYIRYDSSGHPTKLIVSDAKFNTAKLGNTKHGKQMSKTWCDYHLKNAADSFHQASKDIANGNYLITNENPPLSIRNTTQVLRIDNGKKITAYRNNDGKLVLSSKSKINESDLKQLSKKYNNTGDYINACADGRLEYGRVIYEKITPEGDNFKLIMKNLETGEKSLINTAKLPKQEQAKILQTLEDTYVAHEIHFKGISESEARIRFKEIRNKPEEWEEIINNNEKITYSDFTRGGLQQTLQGSTLAALFDFAGQLFNQYCINGEICLSDLNIKSIGVSALLGGASAFTATITNNAITLAGIKNSIFSQNTITSFTSGAIGAAFFSYGSYMLGMVDITTAHRSFVAGLGSHVIGMMANYAWTTTTTSAVTALGFGSSGALTASLTFVGGVFVIGAGILASHYIMKYFNQEDMLEFNRKEEERISGLLNKCLVTP